MKEFLRENFDICIVIFATGIMVGMLVIAIAWSVILL